MDLSETQKEKLGNVVNAIGGILIKKATAKNSKPVFLRIDMANGGFRAIEEFKQETVSNVRL